MKKYLVYLQQQEKLSIIVGVLLGLVLLNILGTNETDTVLKVFAAEHNVEGVESLMTETVEITEEKILEKANDVITSTAVTNNLVSDDTLEKSLENRTNVITGGITVEKKDYEDVLITDKDFNSTSTEDVGPTFLGDDTTTVKSVPNDIKGCKSYNLTYMPYTTVTSKNSNQYKLLYSDECYTDINTGIRMVDGRYCIAMGSYYSHKVGQKVDLVFTDGRVVHCIIGDCKADVHTDPTHRFHSVDGSVAEFVVDYEYFNSTEQWSDLCGGTIEKVIIID